MEENWVLLFSSSDEKICKKAKSMLKKERIKSLLEKKNENNVFVGEYELFVDMNDIGNARLILKGIAVE